MKNESLMELNRLHWRVQDRRRELSEPERFQYHDYLCGLEDGLRLALIYVTRTLLGDAVPELAKQSRLAEELTIEGIRELMREHAKEE